jgi:hypothetical protein
LLDVLLDPADRRAVLERELEHAGAYAEMLREVSERIGAIGGHPFAPTGDLGLRTTAVMRDWLREQLARAQA